MKTEGNLLFPIFLKLDEIHTLIVGGGNVGLEKLTALLKNNPGAKVTLVGRTIKQEVRELAQDAEGVIMVERDFHVEDLNYKDLVILATEKRETNQSIRHLSKERGILTNVADTPDLCDFYLGSTVKKGNLKIGISTNGQSPTFAKRFRELLEEILPDEVDSLLGNLRNIRDQLKGDFSEKVKELDRITEGLLQKEKS